MLPLALLLVVGIRIALWVLPSGLIARQVQRVAADRSIRLQGTASPDVVVWAVEAASRRVPGATCLTQALAAHVLLRRNGMDPELCLGAARGVDGGFRAHAWVELGGRIVIGGGTAGGFQRFPALASARGKPVVRRLR